MGLLWVPLAALICARMARARNLNPSKYAIAGAVYSMMFFWPWVYLIARLNGKTIPSRVIRGAYILLYGFIWPAIALSFLFPTMIYFALPQPLWLLPLLLMFGCCIAWLKSKRSLIGSHQRSVEKEDAEPIDMLPNRAYLMPFAHVYVWLLVAVATFEIPVQLVL